LVLDLDGTLVDSAPDLAAAMNRRMKQRNLAPFTRDEIVPMIGDGVRMLMMRAFAARKATFDEAELEAYIADYTANSTVETRLFPGVIETLRRLIDAHWLIAVCTNKPSEAARSVLSVLGVTPFLAAIGGGDSFSTRKPDPGHLLGTLRAAGGRAEAAVMVGDHANDVRAATAAGIPCIFAGWGYGSAAMAVGAASIATAFSDLPAITENLLGKRPAL
jgi:phosphoglycolate phosphatase